MAIAELASISNADSLAACYVLGVNLILAAFPEDMERIKVILAKFIE